MQLEEYFDFLAPDDIQIKGHRIGIETVLYDYLFCACTPEEIQKSHQQRKTQALNPHPAAERLRKLKAEKQAKIKVNGTEVFNG